MIGRRLLNGDVGISVLLGAGGLYWMFASITLGFWQGFAPRPGFLPFCYGALLLLLSGAIFIGRLRGTLREEEAEPDAHPWKPILLILLIALTLLGMKTVGFAIAAFIALLVMFAAIEKLPVLRSIVVAAAASAFFHLLLSVWLGVPLPIGPLGF